MKGDFSRYTFDPSKHYQQVLMQQGRAQLDADWNEEAAVGLHRDEITTADVIGKRGGPADGAAFGVFTDAKKLSAAEKAHLDSLKISTSLSPGDFFLSAGRYYVDGILCENEWPVPYTRQPDRLEAPALTIGKVTGSPTSGPIGVLEPGGGSSRIERAAPGPPPPVTIGKSEQNYLIYLDVWQRHLTALEAPEIREAALGGPDTATRVKTVWQVRAVSFDNVDAKEPCNSGDFAALFDPGTARLVASTASAQNADDPCLVPPSAGFRGLENQLYRVEIHTPGKAINGAVDTGSTAVTLPDAESPQNQLTVAGGNWAKGNVVEIYPSKSGASDMSGQVAWVTEVNDKVLTLSVPVSGIMADDDPRLRRIDATLKWSRENGSVVTAIEKIDGKQITVSSVGPDKTLGFVADSWVEILDDALELEGLPGQLLQIDDVDETSRIVTLKSEATPLADGDAGVIAARHPKLRRWEDVAAVKYVANNDANWLALEYGVQVRFAANGSYRTGHFWQIPARTARAGSPSGDIEWPIGPDSKSAAIQPLGITHHLCRLGIVTLKSDNSISFIDCRCLYPALTAVPRLFYVSGDGQEVMPDLTAPASFYKLPQSLVVGVPNAQCLTKARTVRFSVTTGDGQVTAPGSNPGNAGKAVDIPTDSAGLARCDFSLDGTNWGQQVTAYLLDTDGNPVSLPLIFNANLSIASQVAYNPGDCGGLNGQKTVQAAIDQLASTARIAILSGDGQDCAPGDKLAKPVEVSITSKCGPLENAVVSFSPEGQGTASTTGVTGPDGIARCEWTPDATLNTQQLVAKVESTPNGETIDRPEFVRFTANLRASGEASCCCVTVGTGGDFKTLDEALTILLEKRKVFDICVCLFAGDHEVTKELSIQPVTGGEVKQSTHVRITGCGRNTRIFLKAPLTIQGLGSIALYDLTLVAVGTRGTIVNPLIDVDANPTVSPVMGLTIARSGVLITAGTGNAILIAGCAEVTIKNCQIVQSSTTATDFVTIGTASLISIEDSVFASTGNSKANGAAVLIIADAKARTAIRNNVIRGPLRFYGVSGPLTQRDFESQIARPIVEGTLSVPSWSEGPETRIESNSLWELAVDKDILQSIERDGDNSYLQNLFPLFSLLHNTFDAATHNQGSFWLGQNVSSTANFFYAGDQMRVATAAGDSFVCVGNSANIPGTTLNFAVPSGKAGRHAESANLVTVAALT